MKITNEQAKKIEKICYDYVKSDCYISEAEDVITDILCILGINYDYTSGKLVIDIDEEHAESNRAKPKPS